MVTAAPVAYGPRPSSLADVLDLILDKGLVIDAYVRVSLAGIELLTIDARIVVASVDTYLRFAEAVNRLDLQQTESPGLRGLMEGKNGDDDGKDDGKDDEDQHDGEARGRDARQRSGAAQRDGRSSQRAKHGPARALGQGGRARHSDDDGDGGLLRRLGDRGRVEPARRGRGR